LTFLAAFRKKKIETPLPVVSLVVDIAVYEQLKERALVDGISENDVLAESLKRGMNDFWLHLMKDYREDYELIKKLFEHSKHDSDLLNGIINQNERFSDILKGNEKLGENGVENHEIPVV